MCDLLYALQGPMDPALIPTFSEPTLQKPLEGREPECCLQLITKRADMLADHFAIDITPGVGRPGLGRVRVGVRGTGSRHDTRLLHGPRPCELCDLCFTTTGAHIRPAHPPADGCLASLPALLDTSMPSPLGLPSFILALACTVDWFHERPCFRAVAEVGPWPEGCRVCGLLCPFCRAWAASRLGTGLHKLLPRGNPALNLLVTALPCSSPQALAALFGQHTMLEEEGTPAPTQTLPTQGLPFASHDWQMQHQLLPLLRARLVPDKLRARDGTVQELTRLEQLYRVFERC